MGHKQYKKIQRPIDRHYFYEASVQSADHTLAFIARIFKKWRNRKPRGFREDFCGTALLSSEWVQRGKNRWAMGVDLDRQTLKWAQEHHTLPPSVELVCDNVLHRSEPRADIIGAFNFSYCAFKTREALRAYAANSYHALVEDGILVMDIFGGQKAMGELKEKRWVEAGRAVDGTAIPRFKYIWEQRRFNAINHHLTCMIHFHIKKGPNINKAFVYDWRLWTIPELTDILQEAGFEKVVFYGHGWFKDGSSNDRFAKRSYYANEDGWLGYIVAIK